MNSNKIEFDPVKEEKDGVLARRAIWSTVAFNRAIEGLNEGRKLSANPFFMNNIKLAKAELVFQRTPEEIEEFRHCMQDIVYFANKYCKLMTPLGVKNIVLRDYQKRYLKHVQDNRLSIYLACRQCGKTTTSAIFMLWYILFNVDKNALVLGNKLKTAVEILDKLRSIYMELPFFLKPGIRKWNQGELAFDNGCRIMAEATTINSGIGFTFHCVLADEFAHIPPNILDSFYNNLFPVVTAARARFMITSTQNGYNLMQRLYVAAVNGENEYAPFKTDWDEVPEWDEKTRTWRARDDEWYRLQVANYGSEEAFNAQFGTQFCIKSKTLISPLYIKKHSKDARAFVQNESVIYGDNWFFDPQYDISRLRSDRFVFTCDISEGTGADYTVFAMFTVHKSEKDESPIFTNVGYYASARASIDENIEALANFCNSNLSQDHYIISIEYNLYGELFYRLLMSKLEHASGNEVFDETVFVKYKSPTSEKMIPGVKITINSKKLYCNIYKQLFETGHIISPSLKYVTEMQNFVDKKENGSYEAVTGHDDLMMTHIQLAAVKETTAFKYFIDEMTSSNSKENEVDMYELMNMANEQFALQQPFQDDIYGVQ